MSRPLPQDRALLMKLLTDSEAAEGILAGQLSGIRIALEEEAEMRPSDEILFQQTGCSRLHHHGVTSPLLSCMVAAGFLALPRYPMPWECLNSDESAALASGYRVLSAGAVETLSECRRHAQEMQSAEDPARSRASMLAVRDAAVASLRDAAGQLARMQEALGRLRERVLAALDPGAASQGGIPPFLQGVWHEFTDTQRLVLEKIWETRKPEGTPVADLFPLIGWEGKEKADKNIRVHLTNIKRILQRCKLPLPWQRKKGRIFWLEPGANKHMAAR